MPTCKASFTRKDFDSTAVNTLGCIGGLGAAGIGAATAAGGFVAMAAAAPSCYEANKGFAKAAADPCFPENVAKNVERFTESAAQNVERFNENVTKAHTSNPYYQNMPKDDASAATAYASQMGGESYDTSGGDGCNIM